MAGYEIDRIVIIQNSQTQYDVLNHFESSLAKSMQRFHVAVDAINPLKFQPAEMLKAIYSSPPDCTLAFNGLDRLAGEKLLAEELELPHVAWLVDSAYHFREYADFPYNLLILPDMASCSLMRKWGAKHAHFIPHGCDPLDASLSFEKRDIPIAFLGSVIDPDNFSEKWEGQLSRATYKFLLDAVEDVLSNPDLTYQEILSYHSEFDALDASPLVCDFDILLRAVDRVRLLKSLEGLPVHIYGNAISAKGRTVTEILGLSETTFTVHPPVNFEGALALMQRSKVVLNSSPMFKTGGHERIFYAQSAGALVLTNATPWIRENYKEESEILCYRGRELEKSKPQLEMLLSDPQKWQLVSERGREKVLKNHTWDARGQELLTLLQTELLAFSE